MQEAYCGYCGQAMRASSGKHEKYYYYRDATHIEKSGDCTKCSVRAELIGAQVVDWLREVLDNK